MTNPSRTDTAASGGRGPRGPYAKSADARKRILDACIEQFGETGFHGATMKEIAKRAGISHTGLLHHFRNKEELLQGILSARDAQARESVTRSPTNGGALEAQLELVRYTEEHRGLAQLYSVINAEGTAESHPAHEHNRARYRALRDFNTGVFAQLAADGRLRTDADPRILATLFTAVTDGLQLQWLYDGEDIDLAETTKAFIAFFVDAAPKPTDS
ncbi:TetR/AcrR family transcriptional regulator [Streptomyces sp. NPDC002643]